MLFTLEDVVKFCHEHCKKLTYRQWATVITSASDKDELMLVQDAKGLVGAMVFQIRPATKVIFVTEIVCIRKGFATFISKLAEYPGYIVKGFRRKHNEYRTYTKEDLWVVVPKIRARQQAKCFDPSPNMPLTQSVQ